VDLGLFGGWSNMVGTLIEAVVFYFYAILLLRISGKTTVGTARIFDFVSTVAMGAVASASSRNGRFYQVTTNTPRLLYDGSRFLDENLSDERITREDVKAKIRESGHRNMESVAAVVLETTGNVAVISSSVPTEPAEPDESLMGPVARH
jgi:uncharacterized membrane protein YcaP (DUF421 family)